MTFDPRKPEIHEVRVRSRGVRISETHTAQNPAIFIPPIAPISTHIREMEKGEKGWSDYEFRPETVTPVIPNRGEIDFTITGDTIVRKVNKPRTVKRVHFLSGPNR